MRASRRLLAALFAAVTLALPAAASLTATGPATASCPYGTAWDNILHRCL
jgi:hypothetical protein